MSREHIEELCKIRQLGDVGPLKKTTLLKVSPFIQLFFLSFSILTSLSVHHLCFRGKA